MISGAQPIEAEDLQDTSFIYDLWHENKFREMAKSLENKNQWIKLHTHFTCLNVLADIWMKRALKFASYI